MSHADHNSPENNPEGNFSGPMQPREVPVHPPLRMAELMDRVEADHAAWVAAGSPYLDGQRFTAEGLITHPVED